MLAARPTWEAPSPGYVRTMVRGLRQLGVADDRILSYLGGQPGMSPGSVQPILSDPTQPDSLRR